jgi:hypothetical protein
MPCKVGTAHAPLVKDVAKAWSNGPIRDVLTKSGPIKRSFSHTQRAGQCQVTLEQPTLPLHRLLHAWTNQRRFNKKLTNQKNSYSRHKELDIVDNAM